MHGFFKVIFWGVIFIGTPIIFTDVTQSWQDYNYKSVQDNQKYVDNFEANLWNAIESDIKSIDSVKNHKSFQKYYTTLREGNYDTLNTWVSEFVDSSYQEMVSKKVIDITALKFYHLRKKQNILGIDHKDYNLSIDRFPMRWVAGNLKPLPHPKYIKIHVPDSIIKQIQQN